jgi:hypothetical protein
MKYFGTEHDIANSNSKIGVLLTGLPWLEEIPR